MKVFVFLVALVALICSGCDDTQSGKAPPIAKENDLEPGAQLNNAGVGVAIADMNGDGHLDIVVATPNGVKYFENNSKGAFLDRGVIADSGAQLNNAGIGLAVADIDGNGIPDVVVASPNGVRIIKNPIQQKK
ncbi:MAG: hypothetical protein G01um10143_512 [Parcubacteria group bacterium Gr01-1014_3]|nr:MAG: hypothetical protein G01um10143_512 [Parcubacteria group bacterium Gr01-1014_3]